MATASGNTIGTYHDVPLVKYYPKWISQGTVKAVNTADLLRLKTRIGYESPLIVVSNVWVNQRDMTGDLRNHWIAATILYLPAVAIDILIWILICRLPSFRLAIRFKIRIEIRIYSAQCRPFVEVYVTCGWKLLKPCLLDSRCAHTYHMISHEFALKNTLWWTNIAMENHHFSWENPLFQWPFSIAMLVHQRVNNMV